VVLLHHTNLGLEQGVALPDADLDRPVAAAGITLCADVTIAVRMPCGISYVRCLRHMREAPFTLCRTSMTGMTCTLCRHVTQQVCHRVSGPFSSVLFLRLGTMMCR
jgi:hypothetical protein